MSTLDQKKKSKEVHQEQEGVIKFNLDHQQSSLDLQRSRPLFLLLNEWRDRLYQMGLIGVDPYRYDGIGFGNVSMRLMDNPSSFLITGSQTGLIQQLTLSHYCRVLKCDFQKHTLVSQGEIHPSSESMTHAMMYQLDSRIKAVFHVHSPLLWNSNMIKLPSSPKSIGYGTIEMTQCVYDLYHTTTLSHIEPHQQGGHLRMGGHQDGIISIGTNIEEVGNRLLSIWYKACQEDR